MKCYDDYIVFLLGADCFDISKFIRQKAKETGDMYGIYELCVDIAEKFSEYDNSYEYDISTYDCFANFLYDYWKEIKAYINGDIDYFEVKKEND